MNYAVERKIRNMSIDIHKIPMGACQSYIIRGEGAVMIDSGTPKKKDAFIKGIESASINPESINLLILTHGHWDHIGSAREIKELTGASIAMHKNDQKWLEKAQKPLPPGVTLWGKIFIRLLAPFMPFIHIPPVNVDIALGDEDFSLHDYGVPGKIVHTPGHSPGSVSVLLDTGDVFVGDSAMNAFPMRLSPGLPIFAENLQELKDSWQSLLNRGAKMVYPAHGKPFPAEIMQKCC